MAPTASAPLESMLAREQALYAANHPRSREHFAAGQAHYLYGAPSHWMRRWAGGFPLYAKSASGAHLTCVDDFDYVDLCLGDTGGMCGHAPEAVTEAVSAQLARGATLMLPTPDAEWVGAELSRRFGLPYWGFTTSASDSNRAAIRMARMITGRDKVLVFNGCYHGSVEEAHVALVDGRVAMRNGIHANAVDHARVSKVVEFNDLAALEAALAPGDVACVLTEPMMTNYGMIVPEPGYLPGMRELTRRTATLLIIDETHTFSNGPGGYTAAHGLEPDLFVIGAASAKPSNLPCSTSSLAARMKPPHADRASAPPMLTRRTPSAAICCMSRLPAQPMSRFTGFGATPATTARMCSGVRMPGA
jgi:glutamate-1-semialdehyde 2,1-aminomutase